MGDKLKELVFVLVLIAIPGAVFYFIAAGFYYVDVFHLCFIRLSDDILNGNKVTIKKGIELIKRQSPEAYKNVCASLDMVIESYCLAGDVEPHSAAAWSKINEPGCYIRGSKVIYIKPDKKDSEDVIMVRAEAIEYLAQKSKEFWRKEH